MLSTGFTYDNGMNQSVSNNFGAIGSAGVSGAAPLANQTARTTIGEAPTVSQIGGMNFYANRAFIQLAGFTFGRAVS